MTNTLPPSNATLNSDAGDQVRVNVALKCIPLRSIVGSPIYTATPAVTHIHVTIKTIETRKHNISPLKTNRIVYNGRGRIGFRRFIADAVAIAILDLFAIIGKQIKISSIHFKCIIDFVFSKKLKKKKIR